MLVALTGKIAATTFVRKARLHDSDNAKTNQLHHPLCKEIFVFLSRVSLWGSCRRAMC